MSNYERTPEEVEKVIDEILNDKGEQERSFNVVTGKQGALEYIIMFHKESGVAMNEKELRKQLNEKLKEGTYRLTNYGLKYIG